MSFLNAIGLRDPFKIATEAKSELAIHRGLGTVIDDMRDRAIVRLAPEMHATVTRTVAANPALLAMSDQYLAEFSNSPTRRHTGS